MKIGIIGYGVYEKLFLGKCAELHAFDFRPPSTLLNYRISSNISSVLPSGIHWHLGKNALEYADILSQMDIVIMSGSSIANNSYLELSDICKNARIRGIYGPSCELCPDYLFDAGFNYIFSTSVKEKAVYLNASFSSGSSIREFNYMNIYELTRNPLFRQKI